MSGGDTYITTFAAKLVNETSIKLTWTGKYNNVSIYQSTDKDKTYTALAEFTQATSYTLTNLTPNTVYFFNIIPYDIYGEEGTKKDTFITTPYNIEITSFYAGSPGMTTMPLYWHGIYYSIRIKYKRSDQSDDYITDIYPIIGSPSYIVTNLDVDTSYNFQIIPYDLNDFSGTPTNILYTKTDYLAYVGNIYLGAVTSQTAEVSWDGRYSSVNLQYSTNNKTFDTKSSIYTSDGGSYTFRYLEPITDYYFRIIPFDEFYNVGITSTSVSGETLSGFKTVETTSVSYNSVVLTWDGSYSYVEIYQSSDEGVTYDLIDTVSYSSRAADENLQIFQLDPATTSASFLDFTPTNNIIATNDEIDTMDVVEIADKANSTVSFSYTVDNLAKSTNYKFYLLPYYNGVLGTSSEIISVTTDYNPDASFSISTPTIYTLPLIFTADGLIYPYYTYCKIEISMDNTIFYDVSTIYQVPSVGFPYTYTITDYSGVDQVPLIPNYTYYVRVTPYSSYNTAGKNVMVNSHSTLGNIDISTFSVTLDSNLLNLNWSGYFKATYLEYATDDFTGASDITSLLVYRSNSYPSDTTDLISSSYVATTLSPSQTYYFRLKPVNYDGDIGATTTSIYNATITGIYLTNITSTSVTLNWVGTYSTVTVQSSTDGSTYSNVSDAINISGSSISITTSGTTVTYYRIIPYSDRGSQGNTSNTAYIPIVSTTSLSVSDPSTVVVTWSSTSDYANILYSSDNITYYTGASSVYSPSAVSFNGMDASNQTYYFKVVPYAHGYPTTTANFDVSGVASTIVYNPTITTAYFSALTGTSSYNSIKVNWKGTYAGLYIYYDVSYNFPSNTYVQITVANSGTLLKNTIITNLLSNTTYYLKLVPYNSNANNGLYYPIMSATTNSLLTGFNFAYNSANSTSSSIRLTWSDNNYYYIKIYGSDETYYGIYYNTTTYLDITGLSKNAIYTFYAVVYDTTGNSERTANVTAYTSASASNLNLIYQTSPKSGYTINPKKIIFSWDNSGYYSIGIENTTIGSSTTTYYSSDGTTSYDSFLAGEGNLVQNTYYTYLFTLKNAYGTATTFTQTVNTLGTITAFDISKNTFTASQIPIDFTGIFNYVIADVSDGVTQGNTYIYDIGSRSNSVRSSYNLTSSNSIIREANKKYWITLYPANDASNVGLASDTYSAKTLGAITRFYSPGVLDNSSIAVYWDGSFASVTLESSTNSEFSSDLVSTRISNSAAAGGAGSSGYVYDGLLPNKKYYFRVTPLNQPLSDGNDVSGVTVSNNVSGTTLGKLTTLYTAAYYDTSAVVVFDGSFTSIDISANSSSVTYTTQRTTGTNISNLIPGSTYTVTTVLRNSAGYTVAGNSISFTTCSKVTGFSATAVDSSSISVSWEATGEISYVTLVWNTVGGTYGGTDSTGVYTTSPAYITGLSLANKRYYFQITPTSSVGDGYIVKDASDVTWGKLNSFYVDTANITSKSIPLKWDGSFNRLKIQQSLDGITYVDASNVTSYDSSGVSLTGLYSNKLYYIRAIPINSISVNGTTTKAITGTTLAYIGDVSATNITSSSFVVNVDLVSSTYSSFYVVNNTAGGTKSAFVTYPDNSITLSDLSANTSYDVVLYAYNYNEIDGSGTVVTYAFSGTTTLATITGAATANVFTDLSSAYYSITLYGSYTSFKLQYVLNGVTYNTAYASYGSKITVSDLSANTTYTYTAYANNKANGAGTDVSSNFTVTTLGATPAFNPKTSPDYAQTNSITFDIYEGDYAAVRIKTSTTVDMSSGLVYTVDISNSNIKPMGNVYIQGDLSVNTQYYFNSTPINSYGTPGNASTTLPLATLGNLTAVSLGSTSSITASSIPISWSGAYNTVTVDYATKSSGSYSTFATYSNSTTPTWTIINSSTTVTGLLPNTAYYFRATPNSFDNLPGTTRYIMDISAMTLPTITTNTISATIYDTSATISFDGSFSTVRIYSVPSSLDKTYTWSLGGITTGTDISGLTANTSYTFYYVPYNSNKVPNPISVAATPIYSSTFYTQPRILSNKTTTTDSSSISISWAWSGSSTSAITQVSKSSDAAIYTPYTIVTSAGTTSTITNLTANTKYYFALTPKAQSDTSGYTVYIKDNSAVTLGNIISVTTTEVSDLSAIFTISGVFSGARVYNPINASYTTFTGTNNIVESVTGLTANTSYALQFYPKNSYEKYSNIGITSTVVTLGNIISKSATLINDSSAITIGWTGNYSSVNVYYSTDTAVYRYYSNTSANSLYVKDLSANTRYYFKLIPTNSSGVTGKEYIISDASAITMGNITAVSASVDCSSISFNVSGYFSGIKAYNSTLLTTNIYYGTNSIAINNITGLTPNTGYTYQLSPLNSLWYTGTYYQKSYYTTPNITDASATPTSNVSLLVSWKFLGTSNSNVAVTINTSTNGTNYTYYTTSTAGSTSANILGLSSNTKYYIRLVPKGYSDTSGSSVDISGYTYGVISGHSITNIDASSAKITANGTFTKVRVTGFGLDKTYTA